jgi:hypothetical protein
VTPSVRGSPTAATGYLAHQTYVQHGCITHIAEQRAATDQVLPFEGLALELALHLSRAVGTSAVPAARPGRPDATRGATPFTADTASAVTGYAAPSARPRSLPHAPNGYTVIDGFRSSGLEARPYQWVAQQWRPTQEEPSRGFLGGLPSDACNIGWVSKETPLRASPKQKKVGTGRANDRCPMP